MSNDPTGGAQAPGFSRRLLNLALELMPIRLVKIATPGFRCESGVIVKSPGRLRLGRDVVLQRGSILHCGGRDWSSYCGSIELGDHVVVGPYCILYGAGTITVGEHTHFGPGSKVMSQSGDSASQSRLSTRPGHIVEPVVIGRGVWIGAGAVILGGTTLGDFCTVSPNSVVSGAYEAGTTLIGNPARPARRAHAEAGSR